MFDASERWAIYLSTLAGLSTTLGGLIAVSRHPRRAPSSRLARTCQLRLRRVLVHYLCEMTGIGHLLQIATFCPFGVQVVRRPDDAMLAFLLGTAIGVMLVLSVMEMWVHNAMEHGWYGSTISFLAGTLIYQLVQPLLPDGDPRPASATPLAAKVRREGRGRMGGDAPPRRHASTVLTEGAKAKVLMQIAAHPYKIHERPPPFLPAQVPNSPVATVRSQRRATTRTEGSMLKHSRAAAVQADSTDPAPIDVGLSPSPPESPSPPPQSVPARSRELLRLGALMAATMTMHNLPEGVAVAFSSFTPVGPIMAAAVAVHNIPEGVIVAAPIYAATGSRWRALAWATASGLSEPIGALCALLFIRPWVSPATVHGALGVVGGVMAAVCVLELWPEARKCRSDRRLAAGCVVGAVAMFWTLLVGV